MQSSITRPISTRPEATPRASVRSAHQQQRALAASLCSQRNQIAQLKQAREALLRAQAAQAEDAAPASGAAAPAPVSVPQGPEATIDQAVKAMLRAHRDGITRQQVQFLLPLIGATELDDWPGGIRQQFKAAAPMLEAMLLELKKEQALAGKLTPSILDDGDAVGAWTSDGMAAVLFPTAETLKQVRSLAEARPHGLSLLANPQWSSKGQIVSDFGWGPWRKANEELVGSFRQTYCFKQMRILGEEVRVLYAYPGQWQLHVLEDDGTLPLVWSGDAVPSYTEMEALLRARPGSKAAMGPIARIQAEIEFNMKQ